MKRNKDLEFYNDLMGGNMKGCDLMESNMEKEFILTEIWFKKKESGEMVK